MKEINEKSTLEFLKVHHSATIEELSANLFISPSTVRRTLNKLQDKGLITRKHGYAQINDENNYFPSFTFRTHQNSVEKKKIALLSTSLINDGDVIFIDGSTTTFFIAEYLSSFKNIVVVTNGIDTLSMLAKHKITAFSTGGTISQANSSVLVGNVAVECVNNFHANICFISVQSISSDGNVYDCFNHENAIRKVMLRNSTKKVLLADSTKFDKTSPYKLCTLKDFDCIVSNSDVRDKLKVDYPVEIIYK